MNISFLVGFAVFLVAFVVLVVFVVRFSSRLGAQQKRREEKDQG